MLSVTKLMIAMHNGKVHIMLHIEIRPIWGGTFPFLAIFFAFFAFGSLTGDWGVMGVQETYKIARGIKLAVGMVKNWVWGGFEGGLGCQGGSKSS